MEDAIRVCEENRKPKKKNMIFDVLSGEKSKRAGSRVLALVSSWMFLALIGMIILCRLVSKAIGSFFAKVSGVGSLAFLFYLTIRSLVRKFGDVRREPFGIRSALVVICLLLHLFVPLLLIFKAAIDRNNDGLIIRAITRNPAGLLLVSHALLKGQKGIENPESHYALSAVVDIMVFAAAGMSYNYEKDRISFIGSLGQIIMVAILRLIASAAEGIAIKKHQISKGCVKKVRLLASIALGMVCTAVGCLVMGKILSPRTELYC